MATTPIFDMSKAQPIFDMSKAQPIFDMSKAQPIGEAPAAPTQPGMLDPRGGWSPGDALRGAVSGVKNIVAHPLDTLAGMAQPFMASGVSPNGYPTTAATGRPQDSQANAQVQQQAQQGQADAAKFIGQNPAYAIGQVAGPAIATAGVAKFGPKIAGAAMDAPAAVKSYLRPTSSPSVVARSEFAARKLSAAVLPADKDAPTSSRLRRRKSRTSLTMRSAPGTRSTRNWSSRRLRRDTLRMCST
jgi:hypothetical protein